MKNFIAHIHYAKILNNKEKAVYFILGFLKYFYYLGAKAKLLLYKFGIKKSQKVNAYVISIGNITTGGTGKTPVCVAVADYCSEKLNKKTAILSRGYGGKLLNKRVHTVTNGQDVFYTPDFSGDEPYWLATNTKNTAVLTCANRIAAAEYAIEKFGSEVLILDDGFQHIKLHRDLNIMLIDGNLKFGNGNILPQGPLREPLGEIERADVILIMNKRSFDNEAKEKCEQFAKKIESIYNIKSYICNFAPQCIYSLKNNEQLVNAKKVIGFAGIGQPEFFFEYLENQEFEIVSKKIFNDHHAYVQEDIADILKLADDLNAEAIITTEKDAVKIKELKNINIDKIYALKLGVDLNLDELLNNKIRGYYD